MLQQQKASLVDSHKKQFRFEFTQKVSFCFNCSSAIIKDKSGNDISTIKPLKYHLPEETTLPIFLTIPDRHEPYNFLNKSYYIKIRKEIIKNMKFFCNYFKLSNKTFFLALDYFDRICSRMMAFDLEALKQISQICIILASKLVENHIKGRELKKIASAASTNYAKDEKYLLELLNYDLFVFTSYDILMDILKCGFFFNNEEFSVKKMYIIYEEIEKMLYLFSESKFYIDMTHKEIALGIIGLIRETLGLVPFNKNIQIAFMNEFDDIHNYLSCLNKLRKCFKFKVNNNTNKNHCNNHSDSTNDSNSDNNSDNTSENYSDKNKTNKEIVNNSKKQDN